ncbi:ABC transporter ATP-binding protein [Herminiimonas arsenitoxidans]|uniref:ABC transporter ATP-binding protein n=1 Tax=Herminiimonas arsenitoxidans TaxID=1809410 RepID=UPI00097124CB|nr:ABC transporter ATP-binding protein [Herminiimonas arsenitoxidans]
MTESLVKKKAGTSITIDGLTHRFAQNPVLDRIDIHLEPGQVLALLGPSGCGKTTLLKLLAGLLPVAAGHGRILFGDKLVAGDGHFLPPEARGLGMVFQDYALWPHMSVGKNVAFALEMRGMPKKQRDPRVARALEIVGLKNHEDRNPSSLSGGQQQRVALARAIVAEPQVLLFDEPLSNLDRDLRESLCHEIGSLLREMGTTAVYVTHDQEEAFALADVVAVMQGGRIRQLATPDMLVTEPANTLIAEFLKLGTLLHAKEVPHSWHPRFAQNSAIDAQHLFIPQSALSLASDTTHAFRGEVLMQRYRNGRFITEVRTAEAPKGLVLTTDTRLSHGQIIDLTVDWQRLRWLPQAA